MCPLGWSAGGRCRQSVPTSLGEAVEFGDDDGEIARQFVDDLDGGAVESGEPNPLDVEEHPLEQRLFSDPAARLVAHFDLGQKQIRPDPVVPVGDDRVAEMGQMVSQKKEGNLVNLTFSTGPWSELEVYNSYGVTFLSVSKHFTLVFILY